MDSKSSFFIGLHNIVTDKKEWKQLLFYDIDRDEHFSNTVKKFVSSLQARKNYLISYTEQSMDFMLFI